MLLLCVNESWTRVGLSGGKALSSVNYIRVGLVTVGDKLNVATGIRTGVTCFSGLRRWLIPSIISLRVQRLKTVVLDFNSGDGRVTRAREFTQGIFTPEALWWPQWTPKEDTHWSVFRSLHNSSRPPRYSKVLVEVARRSWRFNTFDDLIADLSYDFI